jgi:hypothetical protein
MLCIRHFVEHAVCVGRRALTRAQRLPSALYSHFGMRPCPIDLLAHTLTLFLVLLLLVALAAHHRLTTSAMSRQCSDPLLVKAPRSLYFHSLASTSPPHTLLSLWNTRGDALICFPLWPKPTWSSRCSAARLERASDLSSSLLSDLSIGFLILNSLYLSG